MATEVQILANRRNAQKSTGLEPVSSSPPSPKLPILPSFAQNYDLFMQNKPNLRKAKMNIALYSETNYERKGLYGCRKNKAKQTQFKLEAQRRSLRVSFLESSNRGPIKPSL